MGDNHFDNRSTQVQQYLEPRQRVEKEKGWTEMRLKRDIEN